VAPGENPGWIITNPPYGVRVSGNKDLRDLYARFGSLIAANFANWQAGILCYDKRLTANLGLPVPRTSHFLINGGLPVEFNIYAL